MELIVDFSLPKDKQKLFEILKTRKPRRYKVSIVEDRAKRSNKQLKYYFAVICKILSDTFGSTIEETHEALKIKFNPKQIASKTTGSIITIGQSTTEFTTQDAEAYYELIRVWALTDWDIYIPLPHEYETIN